MLFVGEGIIDSIFGLPGCEPAIQKLPKYGMRDPHMLYKISSHTLYRDYVHKSACQFVYRISLGGICRRENNRDSIFGLPGHKFTIQKLPKYGMNDLHMLYKISFHTLYRNYLHMSECQFVYHRSLGALCRTQNNRYLIFSPPGREPAIQKVPKYGMRDSHIFENNVVVQQRTIDANFQLTIPKSPDQKKLLTMKFIRDHYGTIKVQC
jgi:hypothetical protein